MNRRFEIDPVLVWGSVHRKVMEHLRRMNEQKEQATKDVEAYKKNPSHFSGAPRDEAYFANIEPMYAERIEREKTHYAKVRIIGLTSHKYILVYGKANDKRVKSGTGPFRTIREARNWFINGGR